MTIIQDLYQIFDSEYARYMARRSTKNRLALELRQNLAYLREGLAEHLDVTVMVAGLETQQYRHATEAGANPNSLQKRRLARATYGGVKEFDKYCGWSTGQLVHKVYERIAVLKKLDLNAAHLNVRARLQYLFKLLMVLVAHIDGVKLPVTRRRQRV